VIRAVGASILIDPIEGPVVARPDALNRRGRGGEARNRSRNSQNARSNRRILLEARSWTT
jgi:hypothetical protein